MRRAAAASNEKLRPYLPAPLIRAWNANPGREPVWGERVEGSLMHCDVTGFTAMSERLAERGKEGAEVMVEVLNGFFSRMLGVADGWSGEQIKFGGDAMLLLFRGAHHASLAAACALEMQAATGEFKNVRAGGELHRLRMRIGIHSGSFFLASVGDRDNLLHMLISGPDVNRTAEVEPAAAPGKVALSGEAAQALDGACRLSRMGDGLFRLGKLERWPPRQRRDQRRAALSAGLERYVHPLLRERAPDGATPGEHRRVTVMFINLLGLSKMLADGRDAETLRQANAYMLLVLNCLGANGGFLLGSDASETGDKFIALFGAPVSQAQPEAAALRCALDLDEGLRSSELKLRHRIGVNSGPVFAGEIGSEGRREYTVIGDAVNLAARLATAARWGELIVSDEIARAAGDRFEIQRMRPLRVKGKAAPVRAGRLHGAGGTARKGSADSEELVGRGNELRELERLARRAGRGRLIWAYVSGEAGIGKSRLLRELESRLSDAGWRVLAGQCHAHTSHVPFGAWTGIVRALFEVNPGDGFDRFEKQVARLAPGYQGNAGAVGGILALSPSRAEGEPQMDPESARRMLKDALVAALSTAAGAQPLLVVIEDAHWVDGSSLDLLSGVIEGLRGPVLLIASSREAKPPAELGHKAGATLDLLPLAPEPARRLAAIAGGLDEAQVEAIVARSGGNPLLLSAFARSAAPGAGGRGLPETIEDAITSRIDVLPQTLKSTVRAAAVVGPVFDVGTVRELLQRPGKGGGLEGSLHGIVEAGLARRDAGTTDSYVFTHSVIRDVVYEMLPYSQRRRMHGQVVHHIESAKSGQLEGVCEDLLYHSELAEDGPRTIRYACMSGDRAAGMYAGEAAISYYHRALGALAEAAPVALADRSVLLERVGDSLEVMGRHRDAATIYEESLENWQAEGPTRVRFVAGIPGESSRPAVLCRKTGVSLERAAEFEESLRWLDRALRLLPASKPRLGAQICAAMSVSLFRVGRYEEGVAWGRRALGMAKRSRDRRQIAYSHNMLANSYMERGDLRKAVRHLRQAVRIYHEIADFPGQASSNNNLGMCYHLQGTLDAALYYYRVALQTDQRVGDVIDAMIVRSNIGEVLMTLGRLPEAMDNLDQVVDANRRHGGLTGVAGLAHVNLSRCRLASGDFHGAGRHLRLGRRLLSEAGQAGLLVESELQRAELLLAQGQADLATRAARSGLKQSRELGARLLEARAERILGQGLAAMGRRAEGEGRLRDSVTLARRINAGLEEARSLVALARLTLHGRSGTARAVSDVRRAEKILVRMGARLDAREAQQLLAEAEA